MMNKNPPPWAKAKPAKAKSRGEHAFAREQRVAKPEPKREYSPPAPVAAPERVQKMLPRHGIGSRRQVEEWIAAGRLEINGQVASPGQSVTPADRFALDGRSLRLAEEGRARVFAYRKRIGEVVTQRDPQRRPTVFKRLPRIQGGRWIAIGRLDINTSGLLLFTTDGELARRLMHPSFEVEREYAVRVLGGLSDEAREQLCAGVQLDDGPAKVKSVSLDHDDESDSANRWYNLVLEEGRNREVRRMIEAVGGQVSRLMRVRYGPIGIPAGVPSGRGRELERDEMQRLYQAVGLKLPAKTAQGVGGRRQR